MRVFWVVYLTVLAAEFLACFMFAGSLAAGIWLMVVIALFYCLIRPDDPGDDDGWADGDFARDDPHDFPLAN